MNAAHLHLLLNHLPVFGSAFGLLFLLYAILRKSEELKRAALGLCVITALGTIPAYLTGEPAEEVVEGIPGVDESFIEAHEEHAMISLIGIEALGVVSLAGLFLARKSGTTPPILVSFAVLLAAGSLALVAWTSHLGGLTHHPERRSGFQAMPENEREGPGGGAVETRGSGEQEEGESEEQEDPD
ncbi:MAG: hypothetical protein HYX73_03375 [Acidobacteria bacterium]|nr:hypothetical protein [Acidobacteriota bacterium]